MLKNKKGQFYMIAAIVLSAIIIGISTMPNYLKKTQNFDFYDMKSEIAIESVKTLDFATKSNYNNNQINFLMQNFTKEYLNKKLNKMSLYFIFGNNDNITVAGFQEEDKKLSIGAGGTPLTVTQNSGNFSGSIDPQPSAQNLNLTLNGTSFYFQINNGQNFYYLLTQEVGQEKYLAVG